MAEKKTGLIPESFKTFGDLLRYLRKRARLSQQELAALVDYHYTYISYMENNARLPDASTLKARFIPALQIEDEPEWVQRLIDLASKNRDEENSPAQPSGEEEIYHVPPGLTSILGREAEIDSLTAMLQREDLRLLTIIGPPGVGKTRTAIAVAERISQTFRHGAAFVNFTSITNAEMVLHTLAESLGMLETSNTPGLRAVQTFLQHKNLLIVMDNFEQLLPAAPLVLELLNHAPKVKALVTSREALRLQGEHEFQLQPLPTPQENPSHNPGMLDKFAATRLFIERAQAAQSGFKATKENASSIAEICRRLDGLPLALELAAARIQTLGINDMLAQLERRFDWLTRGQRNTAAWRQTLLGAIEWSHDLLTEPERILFRRLAVFRGGWTLEAAESICNDDMLPRGHILDLLTQLADRSLIVTDVGEEGSRFRFLDTLHHFAQGKLDESGETPAMRQNHLEYFQGWVSAAEEKIDRVPPLKFRALIEAEFNNIRAALEYGGDQPQAIQLCTSAGFAWLRLSHFKEALMYVQQYLPLAQRHKNLQARLYFLATALSYWRDQLENALEYSLQGLQTAAACGDEATQAGIWYYLGDIYREMGRLQDARDAVKKSVEICSRLKLLARLSMCQTSLGIIHYQMGAHDESRAALAEAVRIAKEEDNLWALSYAMRVQADNLRFDGRFAQAYLAFQKALEISTRMDDRISMGMEMANLALLANLLEKYQESDRYARRALAQFRAIGNEYQQPFPLRMIAYAAAQAGDFEKARAHCLESLSGNRSLGHKTGLLACLVCMAVIEDQSGDRAASARLFYALKTELEQTGARLMEPDAKALQALAKKIKNHPLPAQVDLNEVLAELG